MGSGRPVSFQLLFVRLFFLFALREQSEIMNKTSLIEEAFQAIRPVLDGRILAQEDVLPSSADVLVELERSGMPPARFVATVGRVQRSSDVAWHVSQAARRLRPSLALLVAPHVSPTLAEECRQAGVNFLDAAGNAHIDAPGLYLFITGRRPPKATAFVADQSALRRASTLRVVFALLTIEGLVCRPVRDIAQSAGVALGSTSEALAELQALGFVTGRSRDRRLANRPLLVTEWARQYPVMLRDKLRPARYSLSAAEDWRTVRLDQTESVWGAEMAAVMLTGHLVAERGCLYAWADRRALMLRHRLRPDPDGPLEILDAFWPQPAAAQQPVVPALLAYADLLASHDGRNREAASLLEPGLLHG